MNASRSSVRALQLISAPAGNGSDVRIGERAIILKRVTVEDDDIIATGNVVTRDRLETSDFAGVPTLQIRHAE